MEPREFLVDEAGFKECFRALETLAADVDYLPIWEFVLLILLS